MGYDRYEQVDCGVRSVSYLRYFNVTAMVPASLENHVAALRVSMPRPGGKHDDPLVLSFRIDRDFADANGRAAILYPPGLFNEKQHVATYRTDCVRGECAITFPIYVDDMAPELVAAGMSSVMATVTALDDQARELGRSLIDVDLGADDENIYASSKFEDFSLFMNERGAAIYPLPGYAERVSDVVVQFADDNGWRELNLIDEPLTPDGLWQVSMRGGVNYFGVFFVDKSGNWENKVELIDLQRKSGFSLYGGACRR